MKPNVLILISHDTGRHISPYGFKTVDTPNFERLSDGALRFSNAFCTTPQCSPARAALFSGLYPHSAGVMGNVGKDKGWNFPDDREHLSSMLRRRGYQTWLLGMLHESYTPDRLGFDAIGRHKLAGTESAALFDKCLADRDKGRPFYCQIGFHETHRPFLRWGITPDDSKGITVPGYLHDGPGTRRDLAELQGMIRQLDESVGKVLDMLDVHGLRDNTIVIVTTDHGLPMPHAKGTLYDSGTGVMLFMRYPAGQWRVGAADDYVSHVDLIPTLLEEIGEEPPEYLQGRSLVPLLHNQPLEPQPVFTEKTHFHFYDPMRAIRTEKFKYIKNFEFGRQTEVLADYIHTDTFRELDNRYGKGHPEDELYDVENDPDELNNLAEDGSYAAIKDGLERKLCAWMKNTADPLLERPIPSPFYERIVERFKNFK